MVDPAIPGTQQAWEEIVIMTGQVCAGCGEMKSAGAENNKRQESQAKQESMTGM